jgi:hypothetical protein
MNKFTPRALRKGKGYKNSRGGDSGKDKKMAFRRCKMLSDMFIHRSASSLEDDNMYLSYCAATRDGTGLRNKKI